MKFIWIFVLFGIVYQSSTLVIQDRSKRAVTCSKRLPISDNFEHGYDLSEYDIFACPEFGGKRAKFIDLNTCENGVKFNFVDQQKTEYDVPDQFYRVSETASTYISVGHTYLSMSDLREEYIKSTAFENFYGRIEGMKKAMFKNSQIYKEMKSIFANDSKVALVFYKGDIYDVSVLGQQYDEKYFTPEFVNDIKLLPVEYIGNEKIYVDFVKKYGTHVITAARFGAAIYRYAKISERDYIQGKEGDINWEMRKDSFALNDTLEILCENKNGNRQVLKLHSKNRDFNQVIVGGYADTTLYTNRTIPLDGIKALPALVSSELKPISTLVSEDKRKNVETAIKVYMAQAYIRSRVTFIQILIENGRSKREKTNELLEKAKQSNDVYNEEELEKLGDELRSEMYRLR